LFKQFVFIRVHARPLPWLWSQLGRAFQIFPSLALFLGITAATFAQTADKPDQAAKTEQPAKAKSDASADAKAKNKKAKPKSPPKVEPRPLPVAHDLAPMKTIVRVIEDSVDLSPTLVVWLIDRTTSAHDIVSE